MKEFWDERYRGEKYAYGKDPNQYLRSKLVELEPGTILFPAEGEGRNAVQQNSAGKFLPLTLVLKVKRRPLNWLKKKELKSIFRLLLSKI